jgi:hypothetical protein
MNHLGIIDDDLLPIYWLVGQLGGNAVQKFLRYKSQKRPNSSLNVAFPPEWNSGEVSLWR